MEAEKRRANGTTASPSPPTMSCSIGNTPPTRQPRRHDNWQLSTARGMVDHLLSTYDLQGAGEPPA
jgi:hypothetical protein